MPPALAAHPPGAQAAELLLAQMLSVVREEMAAVRSGVSEEVAGLRYEVRQAIAGGASLQGAGGRADTALDYE